MPSVSRLLREDHTEVDQTIVILTLTRLWIESKFKVVFMSDGNPIGRLFLTLIPVKPIQETAVW